MSIATLEKLEMELVTRYGMVDFAREIDSAEVFGVAKSKAFSKDAQYVMEAQQMNKLYRLHHKCATSGRPWRI